MKKKGLRIILAIVLLVLVAVVVFGMIVNSVAKKAVEEGGTYALGVDTRVDTVSLSLVRGQLDMDKLNVANPEGYKTDHLIAANRFHMTVETGSVFSDTVEIPTFQIDGLGLNIEQKSGKTNISEIIDNIAKLAGEEDADAEEGKLVRVGSFVVTDIVATVQVLPIGGEATTLEVKVPRIELKDISSADGKGVPVSELFGQLLVPVLTAVLEKGQGILPTDLLNDLDKNVNGLVGTLGEDAARLAEQAGESLKELEGAVEEVGKTIEGATEGLKDAGEGLKGALESLGGKKE